jgi:cytochrome b subunit of formate dehydrogenase
MSPALARPLLHTIHLLTFVLLFVSGLLLLLPNLRAAITGGYSLVIRNTHRWGGIAFTALPILIIARFGPRAIFSAPPQRTLRTAWQGAHVMVTLVMGGIFALTGFVIWAKRLAPESLVDASQLTHDWLTYAAGLLVAAHLVEIGMAALIARVRAAAGERTAV